MRARASWYQFAFSCSLIRYSEVPPPDFTDGTVVKASSRLVWQCGGHNPACGECDLEDEVLSKTAEATSELAKLGNTALQLAGSFGTVFKEPLQEVSRRLTNEIRFINARRDLALAEKWRRHMTARGLEAPTRRLPLNFAVPLLTSALLEEDDFLQETWAKLLVNAGDSASKTELRVAYVEILRGMSAFDVKNLAALAKATLAIPAGQGRVVQTIGLPGSSEQYPGFFRDVSEVPRELGISLANLARLGCAIPGGGMDGAVVFSVVTVTDLGIGLYLACS